MTKGSSSRRPTALCTPRQADVFATIMLRSLRLYGCMWEFTSILPSILSIFLLTGAISAQTSQPSLPRNPRELVRRTVDNEIKAANDNQEHFLFRSVKTTPKGSVTKIYVQTRDATAGLVVAIDGKPLTPEQRKAEDARVRRFANNPEELRKKRKQEREDSERTTKIVRAIPDAFIFKYAGDVASSPGVGHPGDTLVKLTFYPNPSYAPPSRVEQVLTGMQGFILVDRKSDRLATIDGTLFRDVNFGWGIFGHLDRGGRFLVQQEQVSDDDWEISRMKLNFTGKILLFKNLVIDSNEVFSDFKLVSPNLTFAQALELLHREETASENPTESRLSH